MIRFFCGRFLSVIFSLVFLIASFLLQAADWSADLPTHTRPNMYRGLFTPLAGEGIKQLILRLGDTANQIETKIPNLPDLSELIEIQAAEAHCSTILYASDFGTSGTVIDQP
ncbi:hypothetical protein E3J79_04385, partial [Candidatus Dependentiae bacterium]